jgi:hypothetical protein
LLQWEQRFDLFDTSYPFYQAAALRKWPQHSPVSKLLPELASGNNATLFDHTCDQHVCGLTPAGRRGRSSRSRRFPLVALCHSSGKSIALRLCCENLGSDCDSVKQCPFGRAIHSSGAIMRAR